MSHEDSEELSEVAIIVDHQNARGIQQSKKIYKKKTD